MSMMWNFDVGQRHLRSNWWLESTQFPLYCKLSVFYLLRRLWIFGHLLYLPANNIISWPEKVCVFFLDRMMNVEIELFSKIIICINVNSFDIVNQRLEKRIINERKSPAGFIILEVSAEDRMKTKTKDKMSS